MIHNEVLELYELLFLQPCCSSPPMLVKGGLLRNTLSVGGGGCPHSFVNQSAGIPSLACAVHLGSGGQPSWISQLAMEVLAECGAPTSWGLRNC